MAQSQNQCLLNTIILQCMSWVKSSIQAILLWIQLLCCDSQVLWCQTETLSNRKKRRSKGFSHTAWSCRHVSYTHINTHYTVASKGDMMTVAHNQALNGRLCVICKSQRSPTARSLSAFDKSELPLTCLPVTSCLSPHHCCSDVLCDYRAGGKPRKGPEWVGLTEGQPQRVHSVWFVFFCLLKALSLLDPHPASESQMNSSWWELTACLTACGYVKCTDFHMLILRSGVTYIHKTRDHWSI